MVDNTVLPNPAAGYAVAPEPSALHGFKAITAGGPEAQFCPAPDERMGSSGHSFNTARFTPRARRIHWLLDSSLPLF